MKVAVYNNPETGVAAIVSFSVSNISAKKAAPYVPDGVSFWLVDKSELTNLRDRETFVFESHLPSDGVGGVIDEEVIGL
ncbi:hypothetical protein MUJ65_004007 [Vibrio vulnificus]|nr:hypothetical protein [Vibrio vulnificus]